MRKKDILPFVATWIDPKDIVLSEISEKDMVWYHLYMKSKLDKLIETESKMVVYQGMVERRERCKAPRHTAVFDPYLRKSQEQWHEQNSSEQPFGEEIYMCH